MSDSIIFSQEKHIGLATLNRPQALNALSLEMINAFYVQLKQWESDSSIHAVVVCAREGSRAFCAGGDVRWLYDMGLQKDPMQLEFFNNEYKLNQLINDYPKPYIALMDGTTLGGGVGISLHGSHPVASENFSFAMPETSIGFFPDIGASHLLAKCADNFGIYLGLTGNRLNAQDALELGLVKYNICADEFSEVLSSLIACDLSTDASVEVAKCLASFNSPKVADTISDIRSKVKQAFQATTVEEIFAHLERFSDDGWHADTLKKLQSKAPLSLKVTLQQILFAKGKELHESLTMDKHLVANFMQNKDFYEGVRALLVDKDKSPKWSPAKLEDISNSMVDRYFN